MNTNRSFAETSLEYPGDPNGNLKAPKGAVCLDLVSGARYTKSTGASVNTGWVAESFGFVEIEDEDYAVKTGDRLLFVSAPLAPVEITLPATAAFGTQLSIFCVDASEAVTVVGANVDPINLPIDTCVDLIFTTEWIYFRKTSLA